MDRRNFLKQASGYALAAAGTMTGIGQVFASTMHAKEDRTNGHSDNLKQNKEMEHRNLGGMEVSAIGLGCLPTIWMTFSAQLPCGSLLTKWRNLMPPVPILT